MKYYLSILSNGNAIPLALPDGVGFRSTGQGTPEINRIELKRWTQEQFDSLRQAAVTRTISYDEDTRKITLVPRDKI